MRSYSFSINKNSKLNFITHETISYRVASTMGLLVRTSTLQNVTRKIFNTSFRYSNRKARVITEVSSVLNSRLELLNYFSPNDWKQARSDLVEHCPSVTEKNVDSVMIDVCFSQGRNIKPIKSYFNFLQSSDIALSSAIANKYTRIFDNQSVIELCEANEWESAKAIVESNMKSSAIWFCISAAFRNKKHDLGWEYLEKAAKIHNTVLSDVQTTYLTSCMEMYSDKTVLEMAFLKMFQFLRKHSFQPFVDTVETYEKAFSSINWEMSHVELKDRLCPNCNTRLKPAPMNAEDCKPLLELVKKQMHSNENLPSQTFQDFVEFLQKTGPYNFVIDMLNIYPHFTFEQVQFLIKHLTYYNNSVFFIARSRFINWRTLTNCQKNVHCFSINNSIDDDPFLLYAALHSRPDTKIISSDLLRNFKAQLEFGDLRVIFKRWQIRNQVQAVDINIEKESVTLERLLPLEATLHEDKGGWHMPYTTNIVPISPDSYKSRSTWLCLRKPKDMFR